MPNDYLDKVTLNGTTYDIKDTVSGYTSNIGTVTGVKINTTTKSPDVSGTVDLGTVVTSETDPTVPAWAKASSKPTYTASEVGAVPTSRTVNGKALSSNITLSASDVGALYWLIYGTQVIFDEVAEAISGGTNVLVLYEGDTTSLTLPLYEYELTENTLYLKFTNAKVASALGQSNIDGITIEYSTSNGWSYNEVTVDATVVNTYSSTGTQAISGTGVAAALGTLDSSISATTGQAISAITITDGKITGSSKVSVGDANQNAFSNVKVGSTTISADTTTDTLELAASGLVTLTPDATNDKVTISASYTETDPTVPSWAKASTKPTYTASEVGAVPTSRKVNGKALSADISLSASDVGALPDSTVIPQGTVTSIATGTGLSGGPITGSGTISLDGTYGLTTADITTGTDTTNKLVSAKTLADTLGGLGGGTITGVTAGTGLSGGGTSGGVTLNHSNSVTAQNTQAVYPIKIDAQGHISSYGSAVTIPTVPTAGTTATAVSTTSSGGSATTWSKSDHVHSISSSTITSALGYTPYNSTNPDGYITANDVPQELFIVTVTLTNLVGGTSDKTAEQIAQAAAAGKLPVVKIAYGNASMVAALAAVNYDSVEGYTAFFTYENQSMPNMQYATLTIIGSAASLQWKNGYVAIGDNISNLVNDEGYITSNSVPTAGTTATAVSTSASGGSATTWSKSDHVHSISSSTITSALGYTPYNNSNPDGYLTSVTLPSALEANSAIIYEITYTEPTFWTSGIYTINDTLANVVANISSARKVIFRQSLTTGKYNYWQPWFNNPNSNKIGLYRFEKDGGKLYHVIFEPDNGGTSLTGTEVSPYYLSQYDPYAVGKIITTSSINDDPNDYLDGTWTLIDKEFTPTASAQLASSAITLNTTNADGLDLYFSRTGHEIAFTGYLSSKVNISNTNLEMVQSITLSSLGTNAFNFTPILNAQSDSKHAIILMDMDKSSGRIRTLDVVVRGTSTSIAATSDIAFQAVVTCHYTDMVDSACGKFYWKRTA